jgi:hypothetical protein
MPSASSVSDNYVTRSGSVHNASTLLALCVMCAVVVLVVVVAIVVVVVVVVGFPHSDIPQLKKFC